jgi:serine/threonine protein kinase
MATMFGRFEIQSELSKSDTALIYKATDTETNQVVALKTQSLEPLGERSEAFVDALIAEGEGTRNLAGQNIVLLYGAGEMDGQFCAAMEYIQGNSVATMLARKEGFSIWDLLDITRQLCAGLEHAATNDVVHHSLEPAKIMVQWDGMVKILGYGISNMSLIGAELGNGLGRLMPYCSPEQIRGEAIDLRSNLFTVGAILYEMVVSRKAFDAEDPVALVSQIENDMPPVPSSVNAKIHPAVSALIMKALAKAPAERYQSARELVEDLEKCKENSKKAGPDSKKPVTAPKVAVDSAARAAAASKFVSTGSSASKPTPPAQSVTQRPVAPKPAAPVAPQSYAPAAETKVAAAAAGAVTGARAIGVSSTNFETGFNSNSDSKSGAQMISETANEFEVSAPESQTSLEPVLSVAAVEPETPEAEEQSPRVAVDPMMAQSAASSSATSATSFSDLAEMPPLKEPVFTPPPPPEPAESSRSVDQVYPGKSAGKSLRKDEKPKIQPREVAQKAFTEIATVPPRLMLYAILGAVGLILVVSIVIFFHVRSEDDGSTAAPQPTKTATTGPAPPVAQAPVATPIQAPVQTPAPAVAPITEAQPNLTVRQLERRTPKSSRRAPAPTPAPAVIPGQALVDSNPQGAQFQVDGKSDPSWVTPFSLMNLSPGKHIISASKSGYSSEIRSVDVASGSKLSLVLHLTPMNALVVANSTPPGAEIIIDGKPTGRVTPAQFAIEKGSHTVLLRKQGFLDETVTADLGPAQNFQYSPALRALGNTEDMKTVGKFNKLFGHGGDSTAGMGSISVHTQPKGAQVAINQHVLDKLAPLDVMLGPGNYIVDITLTGFKPVHKVVNVDKGGKVAVDEILERQ